MEEDDQYRFGIPNGYSASNTAEGEAGASVDNLNSPENLAPAFSPGMEEVNVGSNSNSKMGGKAEKQNSIKGQDLRETTKVAGEKDYRGSPMTQKEIPYGRQSPKRKTKNQKEISESAAEETYSKKKDVRGKKRKSHQKQCICKPCKKWRRRVEHETMGKSKAVAAKGKTKSTRKENKSRHKSKIKGSRGNEATENIKHQVEPLQEVDESESVSEKEETSEGGSEYDEESDEEGGRNNNKWITFINGLRS